MLFVLFCRAVNSVGIQVNNVIVPLGYDRRVSLNESNTTIDMNGMNIFYSKLKKEINMKLEECMRCYVYPKIELMVSELLKEKVSMIIEDMKPVLKSILKKEQSAVKKTVTFQIDSEVKEQPMTKPVFVKQKPIIKQPVFVEQQPVNKQPVFVKQKPIIKQPVFVEQQPVNKQPVFVEQQPINKQPVFVEQQPINKQPVFVEQQPINKQPAIVKKLALLKRNKNRVNIDNESYSYEQSSVEDNLGDTRSILISVLMDCLKDEFNRRVRERIFDEVLNSDVEDSFVKVNTKKYSRRGSIGQIIKNKNNMTKSELEGKFLSLENLAQTFLDEPEISECLNTIKENSSKFNSMTEDEIKKYVQGVFERKKWVEEYKF